MPRKKLTELKQIDGKTHPEDNSDKNEKFEITTLEQLFSGTGLNRYKTLDGAVYAKEIDEMNLADLRNHATHVGIVPRDVSIDKLKRQLLVEFNRYVSSYQKPSSKQRDIKVSKTVLDIMSEAK